MTMQKYDVALWWSVLAAGLLPLTLSSAMAMTRAFSGRRIPRLGFLPARSVSFPWWAHAGLLVGILLASFGAGQLGGSDIEYFGYLAGSVTLSLFVQAMVASLHNRRLGPESRHDPPARTGLGPPNR